ncbi:EcsC family protein [Kineothrix sedimenti]|uniref:EcsC family protein n=1 Tax=Kineothrix sedimenti TaxID=3123317 RepID=A0ABZ3ERY8_9FIRM
MNLYEKHVEKELNRWHDDIIKSAGLFERTSKGIQKQTQKLVPKKMQNTITATVEKMVQTILFGSDLLTIKEDASGLSLAEQDFLVQEQFQIYMKTAVTQGIGFGAGGILLGLADLPVLMGIKIKFMFDGAKLYGYDTDQQSERLFLLYVFQLAFSSREHRLDVFRILQDWDERDHPPVDWEKFQMEYRDYLDIAKLLQLMPVVGSVAGGTANYKLMNRLKENVMNCYRMRILCQKWNE